MSGREPGSAGPPLGLHHSDLLGRPFPDHLAAHEQLQRHMLLDRERFPHHPSAMMAQHEEFMRYF